MLPKNQIQSKSENFHWRHPNFENVLFLTAIMGWLNRQSGLSFKGNRLPKGVRLCGRAVGHAAPQQVKVLRLPC